MWLGHSSTYLITTRIVCGPIKEVVDYTVWFGWSASYQLPRHILAYHPIPPHIAWGDLGNLGGAYTMWLGQSASWQLPRLTLS